MRELSTREKREEKGSFVVVFFSDQQCSDHIFYLTNRWIGIKFRLSVSDNLVVYLNGEDRIWRSARFCFRSRIEAGFGWCFFLLIFCWCSYCLFSFGTCCVAIRKNIRNPLVGIVKQFRSFRSRDDYLPFEGFFHVKLGVLYC